MNVDNRFCGCCLRWITLDPANSACVCAECWAKLSPSERLAHIDRQKMLASVDGLTRKLGGLADRMAEAVQSELNERGAYRRN